MGVSKESISKCLIGNRFHVKLRILSPYSNRILFEYVLSKITHPQSLFKQNYRRYGCLNRIIEDMVAAKDEIL